MILSMSREWLSTLVILLRQNMSRALWRYLEQSHRGCSADDVGLVETRAKEVTTFYFKPS